jgi:hypothetical protein
MSGDPKLRHLFVEYVQSMGHSAEDAGYIVEGVLQDKELLQESSLATMAQYKRETL